MKKHRPPGGGGGSHPGGRGFGAGCQEFPWPPSELLQASPAPAQPQPGPGLLSSPRRYTWAPEHIRCPLTARSFKDEPEPYPAPPPPPPEPQLSLRLPTAQLSELP